MKKLYLVITLLLAAAVLLSGCAKEKFKEDDERIIGLTSLQIVEKYGDFDRKLKKPDKNGLYVNCSCGYLISEKKVGFLGTTPPKYFMIVFDYKGVALHCGYEEVV